MLSLAPLDAIAQVTTIYGNTNPVPGKKFTVAVLADGYTSSTQFEQDAKNLINYGLMADPYYFGLGSHFLFEGVFQATTPPNTSLFGITISGDISNCYIHTKPDTAQRIFDTMQANVPSAHHVLVLKSDGSTIGCTKSNWWTVVSSGNVNTTGTLEHEFGHLVAALHDEYVLYPGRYPTPPVYGPNCTTDLSRSWWTGVPVPIGITAPGSFQGCKLYAGSIYRPYLNCRMRDVTAAFCTVCGVEMSLALNWIPASGVVPTPPHADAAVRRPQVVRATYVAEEQPPPTPQRSSVRVLISLTLDSAFDRIRTAHAETATDVAAPAEKNYRRTGDYIYEIKVGDTTKETGFLSGNPFEERAYAESTAAPHRTVPARTTSVVVSIPDGRKADFVPLMVEINFYRLVGVGARLELDPAAFARLKPSERVLIGSVTDLGEALRRQ